MPRFSPFSCGVMRRPERFVPRTDPQFPGNTIRKFDFNFVSPKRKKTGIASGTIRAYRDSEK